jgi:hypothetical protein
MTQPPQTTKFIDGHHPACEVHRRGECNCTAGRDPESPFPDRSEIVPHLWQGARPTVGLPNYGRGYEPYDLIVNCEQFVTSTLLRPEHRKPGSVFLHVPLTDEHREFDVRAVKSAGRLVAGYVRSKRDVLVHCTAGLNRSSLVTSAALAYLHGWDGDVIVDHIRDRRDEYCLCNQYFEDWVRNHLF